MESAVFTGGSKLGSASVTSATPQRSTSGVEGALHRIEGNLDQHGLLNDVTHRELQEINEILDSLPPAETRQVIGRLSDTTLKTWADEIGSHGVFGTGGLSADERTDLFDNLATDLDVTQLERVYRAFDDSSPRAELAAAVGRTMETDEVTSMLFERARQLPAGTQRDRLQRSAEGLKGLQHAAGMAHFAADAYLDFSPSTAAGNLQPGIRRLNPDHLPAELGISRTDLIDAASGYYAALYQQGQGAQATYIVAFRGTESGSDWLTNLGSGVGFRMSQFQKADLLLAKLVESVGNDRLEVTGHSLGGGLSNYVGMKRLVSSTAFNPKGTTWRERLELPDDQARAQRYVRNYQVMGDILTEVQEATDPVIMEAPGPVSKLPAIRPDGQTGNMLWETLVEGFQRVSPFHDASQHDISGPIDRHGMDYVRRGLDARIETSESQALQQLFDSFE